jgi:hypothetical protein
MIVSDRAPADAPDPRKAPAYGDDGSIQLRLSEPVSRKLTDALDGVVVEGDGVKEAAGSRGATVDGAA